MGDETANCRATREALSAMLDGEDPGAGPAVVRAHVDGCPDCARWYERADQLGRQLRIAPAPEPGPDVAEAVLGQVELPRAGRWHRPLRIGVLVAAVAQLAVGLAAAFGPLGMPSVAGVAHVNHEESAFNLAFGVGLLVVGINTRAARHQVPVLASLVGVLALGSVADLTAGHVEVLRLATHLPLVVGLVLAAALRRGPPTERGPDRHAPGLLPGPRSSARELPDAEIAHRRGSPPPAAHREAA